MNQVELLELRREAERAFLRLPGVVGVGLGLKVRGGEITDETAFRVYVQEKKPESELTPDELIPGSYAGVQTDVLKLPRSELHVDATPCADRQHHDPLVSGITISTLKLDANGRLSSGTLGFFATIPGVDPPYNIAAVTNQHVISLGGGVVGDTIYQPKWAPQPDGSIAPLLDKSDVVGTVLKMPDMKGDANGILVDGAAVKLDIRVSSWCHTNCGVSFANEVRGLAVAGSNAIADLRDTQADPVKQGDTVFKVGRTTGRTVGRVTDVHLPVTVPGHPNAFVIEVQALQMQTADNCGGALRFDEEGDSGAALIDDHGRLIGLAHGGDPANPQLSHCVHIKPTLDALGVVPITAAHPVHGNPAAVGMRGDAPALIDGPPSEWPALRARFFACEEGRRIAALVEEHRLEVMHLVNTNRRVTVPWHRNKGPAWLNRAMVNARDPEVSIPREIDGVTREMVLLSMERALAEQGSPGLRLAMEEHRDEVLEYADGFDSLHDVVDELAGAVR